VGLVLVVVASVYLSRTAEFEGVVFVAQRGPMVVSVREGGSVEALESQVIRSEVEGREGTKILRIIEEGYQVTQEDVTEALVLVELDSSALEDRVTAQEIDFQATLANLTEAIKQKEVQENRNVSDIKTASLATKFALMDFKKFLGEGAATQILEQLDLNEDSVKRLISDSQRPSLNAVAPAVAAAANETVEALSAPAPTFLSRMSALSAQHPDVEHLLPRIKDYDIDFSVFASDEKEELLGDGEARQQLRKLKDDLLIAESEYALKKKAYEGAQRLADEGYLTPNELEEKKITFEKSQNALATAQANLELFKTYDLQKNAEQFLLDYEKALLELARIKSDAMAELADRLARLEWSRRRHSIERAQLEDLYRQLDKCVIRAARPGLVVYGDGQETWDRDEIIREGATVRERQAIITIPDMREMALTVRVHESQVKRVRVGQVARITVDAEPDRELSGVVRKVSVLPDSENRRFNPDQKVYRTTITVDGIHDWLKPGMNAQAEIIVRELDDVVYFPLQAVFPYGDGQACWVRNGRSQELRIVEVVDYNNRFVGVNAGVRAGESVLLDPPERVPPSDWVEPGDTGVPAVPDEELSTMHTVSDARAL
jgi:HlyD family secretion protein